MANPPQPPRDEPSDQGKPSWISDLARRSTGLPEDVTPAKRSTAGDPSLWRLASVGIQFAVTTALFAFGGYELDQWMGWSPWGLIVLTLLAATGGVYLLVKEVGRQ